MFIVGASGSGKSTMIRLLLKELEASDGRIVVGGRDLGELKRSKVPLLRRNVGCVFQDFKLLPNRTAAENVAYALKVQGESRNGIRRKVPEVLNLVGLADKTNSYPDELSGGEQQRVSIARAVVNHLPLLICDEPTGTSIPPDVGRDHAAAVPDQPRRDHDPDGHARSRDGGQDAEARDRARGRPPRPRRAPRRVRIGVRIRVILSEAFRSVTSNVSTTIAATMTVLISMFVLGLVIALGFWVNGLAEEQKEKLEVKVFFCTALTCKQEVTPAQIEATRRFILSMPEVEQAEFVSTDEALRRMRKQSPEASRASRRTRYRRHSRSAAPRRGRAPRLRPAEGEPPAGGREGEGRRGDAGQDPLRRPVVFIISAIFVALLAIAAAMLIANTIRLSIFARRREIEVMKLVGATNWFVRGPFMIEGVLCALAGTVIAMILLVVGKQAAESLILNDAREIETIGFFWNATILLAVGLRARRRGGRR